MATRKSELKSRRIASRSACRTALALPPTAARHPGHTLRPLGQATNGARYWSDNTLVAGQQFGYTFDDIGNRTSAKRGAAASSDLRTVNYANNALNQLTSMTEAGTPQRAYLDVIGTAAASATVTVNNQPTSRKDTYYRAEISVDNTTSAQWVGLTTVGVVNGTTTDYVTETTGNAFVPLNGETFSAPDADGNMTGDGRWTYTWDAENRLVQMVARTSAGPQQLIKFEYDWQGRRIRKQVWNNTAGSGTADIDQRFVYDGWNLIAVLNSGNAVQQSFVWGLDLSGSVQGAGGVGGLLMVNDAVQGDHFAGYDANGNVTLLVKAADGTVSASYEYGPFGEPLRATGPMAKANPFRFSTQSTDNETDLVMYPKRPYSPSTGRFLSRDPIGEQGFQLLTRESRRLMDVDKAKQPAANDHSLCANSPVNAYDLLGLVSVAIYDGGDPGDKSGMKWWERLCCPPAKGANFREEAGYYDYQIDIRSLRDMPPGLSLIEALNKIKKTHGVEIDKIVIIDHGATGFQEFGDGSLETIYPTHGSEWPRFYYSLGEVVNGGGVISLLGCEVAKDEAYLRAIANATQHYVSGYTGVYNTRGLLAGPYGKYVIVAPNEK